jgi:hypothetical protein
MRDVCQRGAHRLQSRNEYIGGRDLLISARVLQRCPSANGLSGVLAARAVGQPDGEEPGGLTQAFERRKARWMQGGAHGRNVIVDRYSQRRKPTVVEDGLDVKVTWQWGDNNREIRTKRTELAPLSRSTRTHSLRPCIAAQCSAVLLRSKFSKVDWGRRNAAGKEGKGRRAEHHPNLSLACTSALFLHNSSATSHAPLEAAMCRGVRS